MKFHGARVLIGLTVMAMAVLEAPAFAKGRVSEEKVITEPTEFGEVLIAPGAIRVFKDNGDLAEGLLAKDQNVHGIDFKAGTKVVVPDYPLSMNHHDMLFEPGGQIAVGKMQLGEWITFRENPETDITEVETNLMAGTHLMGIDLAQQFYFRYQCDYSNCATVSRLIDFTVANDTTINGISVPALTRVEDRYMMGFYLSKDTDVQGFPVMAADGVYRTLYVNHLGRVIQFNAARTFTYQGMEIPAGYFVRLDNDGKVLIVGNQEIH